MTEKSKTAEKSKNHNRTMKFVVIACRVFSPELEVLRQRSRDELILEYLPLRAHDEPEVLKSEIQALIDHHDGTDSVDAVILAYGLCGNATAGLRAGGLPLYIPRAHDCSQILLGGGAAHREYFGDMPSRGWTSRGYLQEEGDPFRTGDSSFSWQMEELVAQYGEENAAYIWETMHGSDSAEDPVLYFLDVPETTDEEILERARERAVERRKELQVIPATLDLIARLLGGRGGEEILRVEPGETIQPTWNETVMESR